MSCFLLGKMACICSCREECHDPITTFAMPHAFIILSCHDGNINLKHFHEKNKIHRFAICSNLMFIERTWFLNLSWHGTGFAMIHKLNMPWSITKFIFAIWTPTTDCPWHQCVLENCPWQLHMLTPRTTDWK